MQGVAPEADLILCGLKTYTSATNIGNCIKFIFDYATSVNKPAIVSISMGSILGLHDGSDIVALIISVLTDHGTKPGRAVVVSTANAADNGQSIIPNRSLGPILFSYIKTLGCPPQSHECLSLVHCSHET